MCNPKTLALTDLAASSTSSVLSAVGAFRDSQSRKAAAKLKAKQATKKGEDEVRISGIRTGRLFGAQRAAFAANGLDIAGSVTVRDVLADTAEEGVREAVQIRNNAASSASGFRQQAAAESPLLSGAGAALGGIGKVAGKWLALKKAKVI